MCTFFETLEYIQQLEYKRLRAANFDIETETRWSFPPFNNKLGIFEENSIEILMVPPTLAKV